MVWHVGRTQYMLDTIVIVMKEQNTLLQEIMGEAALNGLRRVILSLEQT